jgi:multicomponent Na+:H+ antiporter subunit E
VRNVARGALLVVLWLLAWGEFSIANVASGIVVAAGLLAAFPGARPARPDLRPNLGGIARLGWYVAGQLVSSNLVMTREIVRRRTDLHPGVLAHRLAFPSDAVITIMTSIISLSPGTMTADIDPEGSTVYVHFLFLRDIDAARAGLTRLELLVAGAVGARRPSSAGEADR